MIYPLVSELAADGIPSTVTCRVLNIARQPYYRWLANPVTDAEWDEAGLTNAVFDAHRDDPEFGYRFLADEVRDAGFAVSERTVWKICSTNGWWSVFGKKKARKTAKVSTPAHDDLVRRQFGAEVPNQLWLADIERHEALFNRGEVRDLLHRAVAATR
jgi:putative transposase